MAPATTGRSKGTSSRSWKLEDAKARFSEVVRRAQSDGPQWVTVRGKDTVVVISVEEYKRLLPDDPGKPALVPFLEGLHLDGLAVERDADRDRGSTL